MLGIPYDLDINLLLNEIFESRFKGESSDSKKTFDYLKDFDLIYSMFLRYYNIDLVDNDLHWWKFTALLEAIILEDNALSKRIGYRATKIPKADKYNKDQRQHIINMKNRYALEAEETIQKKSSKGFKGMYEHLKSLAKKR